ncbi:MAG: DUF1553 domain-containing protein [Verrucomicrobiales bacterium]
MKTVQNLCKAMAFSVGLASLAVLPGLLAAEAPSFFRAVNLNGPALTIDGHSWEAAKGATNFHSKGSSFDNQAVPLKPPTDPARAQMIRSSVWGDRAEITFDSVPPATYQVFIYVWEDNHNEQFDLLVNDTMVVEKFHSGKGGSWRRLGPFLASDKDGKIKVAARGGAANLSGVELWRGEGHIPTIGESIQYATATPENSEFFEKKIRPLLVENCYECHSAGASKLGNNLLLDSHAGIVKGGDTGPLLTPGLPEASLLIQAVKQIDPELSMPPKGKLSPEQIADLEAWVKMGAPDPRIENTVAQIEARNAEKWAKAREFWSFQPLKKPAIPEVAHENLAKNDIDRFIFERVEKAGFKPAELADKRTLIRRATYDLTGLPPTPDEMQAFLEDKSPTAFATLIDRLLSSPTYGERWGRYWMDVVRYSDTAGDNSDFPIPQMFVYRKWVIDAFNRDLPYDHFVRHQLAGDLLPAETADQKEAQIIATGYIANARRFGSRVSDYPQHLTIEDTIDNVGRAFLGLSVSCARCHDHKFDPISAEEYYSLYGIFQSTRYPWPGIELDQMQRDLAPLVAQEKVEEARKERQARQKELETQVAELEQKVKQSKDEEKRKLEKQLADSKKGLDRLNKSMLPIRQAYAVTEAEKISDAAIQLKGDPAKPGAVAKRGFLKVLGGEEFKVSSDSSGRKELAEWIVSPKNPVAARVMANRLWLNHFGKGIVPTPNDFGKQGKPPTHPELLDWLAGQFMEGGWSIKSMHRLIMLSHVYQQKSLLSDEAQAKDPNNELLSAFPQRRLDAEAIRDTLLAIGGNLDHSEAGPHPFPEQPDWNFTQHNPFKAVYDTKKRSVYLMTQRIQRHPFLAIFDGADPAASTGARTTSTTPLQALYFLNDPFLHQQSELFAARVIKQSSDDRQRFSHAIQLALGRKPEILETENAVQFLASTRLKLMQSEVPEDKVELGAWTAMARVIFRLNEFVYLD